MESTFLLYHTFWIGVDSSSILSNFCQTCIKSNPLLHHQIQRRAGNLDSNTVLSGFAHNNRDTWSPGVKCSCKQFNRNTTLTTCSVSGNNFSLSVYIPLYNLSTVYPLHVFFYINLSHLQYLYISFS